MMVRINIEDQKSSLRGAHLTSLVHDGYPSELQNLKFGRNFRPAALDGYSIQAISLS